MDGVAVSIPTGCPQGGTDNLWATSPRLVEPTPGELRLISPTAFRLWRALVRVRVEETGWFSDDLTAIARRAKIKSYGVAVNALAELKRAGLVATSRNSEVRWVRDGSRLTTVQAYTTNSYLVAGTCRNDRGVYKVQFPAKPWSEYVAACRWGVRRAQARVAAWRYEVTRAEWNKEWTRDLIERSGSSSVETHRLASKAMGSVLTKRTSKERDRSSKEALRDHSSLPEDDLIAFALEPDLPEVTRRSISMGVNPPLPTNVKAPHRAVDPLVKTESSIIWMSSDLVPEQKALNVVAGYRHAVQAVYGIKWWHYWKGEIKNAKHYDKLVACGEAMADKGVPAEHWAIWRLTWFKANVKQFASKPPPVWMVMSAKSVSEKSGWFRKDYELPLPVYVVDWVRREQICRNQESRLFARGHRNPWLCLPDWYVAKRKAEINDGLVSPFECWPDRSGSKWKAGPL